MSLGPLLSPIESRKLGYFPAKINTKDLDALKDPVESGEVVPVTDKNTGADCRLQAAGKPAKNRTLDNPAPTNPKSPGEVKAKHGRLCERPSNIGCILRRLKKSP
jgi:hypothetical protein